MSEAHGKLSAMTSDKDGGEKAVKGLLKRQEGLITRAQCASVGMTRHAIDHRIRPGGPWQRILPGVYLCVTGTPTIAQREIAAMLYTGPWGVMTGFAALRRHGMRVPDSSQVPDSTKLTVLIPAGHVRVNRAFVTVQPTTRMPEMVCYQGPVQFVLPERAVADAARELPGFREVRGLVADAVQQRLCRIETLKAELERGPVRHSAHLRRALAEVADGIRSGAEGDFRDLILKARLPKPMFNARLYAGRELLGVADAWWPDAGVAGEVDSRAWHLSPEDWENTLARNARLSSQGIVVLHFTPGQIRHEPARVAADVRNTLRARRGVSVPAVRAVSTAA